MSQTANRFSGDHLAKAFKSGLEVAGGLNPTGTSLSTKAEVNYRPCDNNKPNECCADCMHFDGKSSCNLVAGKISPVYVCDKFEVKNSSASDSENAADKTLEPGGEPKVEPYG